MLNKRRGVYQKLVLVPFVSRAAVRAGGHGVVMKTVEGEVQQYVRGPEKDRGTAREAVKQPMVFRTSCLFFPVLLSAVHEQKKRARHPPRHHTIYHTALAPSTLDIDGQKAGKRRKVPP